MDNKLTLEEAAENCWAEGTWDNRNDFTDGFIAGAKWQFKKMYTEKDMIEYAEFCIKCYKRRTNNL